MMFVARTRRIAARLLLGALLAAFAMLSAHVGARPAAPGMSAHAEHAGMATATLPVQVDDEHCNTAPVEPVVLLCKHHCQSEIQTLDHPRADLPQVVLGQIGVSIDPSARVPVPALAGFGPVLLHPGGAPPPYAATARLRI